MHIYIYIYVGTSRNEQLWRGLLRLGRAPVGVGTCAGPAFRPRAAGCGGGGGVSEAAPTTAVPMATLTAMPTPTTAAPVATATLVVERLHEKEFEPVRVMEFIAAKQANRTDTKKGEQIHLPQHAQTLELNSI